jgi:hypothetical protein
MRPLSREDSVRLSEERAVQRFFDERNWRLLRWLLAGSLIGSLIGTIAGLEAERWPLAVAWGVDVAVSLALILARRARFFSEHSREITIVYLVLQAAVLLVVSPDPGFSYALGGYILPVALLFFRLRRLELAGLLALGLAIAVWVTLFPIDGWTISAGAQVGMSVGALAAALVSLVVSSRLTRRAQSAFLADWRVERGRSREQARMREELDGARQIQLSMLPHTAPNLTWLDLASASLPATEVGGDYFDYVPLDGNRLAIVVGDVAGHGMASGLVLAAIRGGLHLLKNELARPAEALGRLDRMVREIAPGRMYVTLQIAILDNARRRLRVVSAGHPPVLHYRAATGDVAEVGGPAIPLGTRLFYSDGVPEAANERGDQFGDHRLAETLRRSATGMSAAEVRSGVLDSVTRFKGDVELADDLTVVVAKVSG